MVGCDVATDGTASARVAGVRWCQRHCQDLAGDLGMSQWAGGLAGYNKESLAQTSLPSSKTEAGLFEEMTGLPAYLERPVVIEPIHVEPVHQGLQLPPMTAVFPHRVRLSAHVQSAHVQPALGWPTFSCLKVVTRVACALFQPDAAKSEGHRPE